MKQMQFKVKGIDSKTKIYNYFSKWLYMFMSKTLWHTIISEVPKERVNITKNDKVVVQKTQTKTNKEPSKKIIIGDINKPKILQGIV